MVFQKTLIINKIYMLNFMTGERMKNYSNIFSDLLAT